MECGIISPVQETTIPYGALAQLVARYIRIVEVTGSNPVCSTTKTFPNEKVFALYIEYGISNYLFYAKHH